MNERSWALVVVAIVTIIIVACVPEAVYVPSSPLAQPRSGIARPHIVLDMRDAGMVYTSPVAKKMNLPLVMSPPGPCGMIGLSTEISELAVHDELQQRVNMRCDPALVRAAQYRANDMASRHYFAHNDPEGHTPNYWARQKGCRLPDWYPSEGNQIESIALNYPTAQATWDAWKSSPGHRVHVLAELDFYQQQVLYGIGYAKSDWGTTYVFMSSPSC